MRLIAAAVCLDGDRIYAIIPNGEFPPNWGHYAIKHQITEAPKRSVEDGFLTDTGRFYDRTQARRVAREAGQTNKSEGTLLSNDISFSDYGEPQHFDNVTWIGKQPTP